MKLSLLTASVLAFVVMSFSQSLETYIVQLPPTAFPELPTNLVQELQRRGCTIPQEAYSKTKPNNVIKASLPNPARSTGPCSARSKASPRSSYFGTARRTTPPPSRREEKILVTCKVMVAVNGAIQEA